MDFSRLVAGAGTTRILAGFGAQVIRCEWPDPPAWDNVRQGHWNLDKLSLTLNMKHPRAMDVARRLLAISDVFTENMRPRAMRSLGLDYETVRELKPDIIYLSMSGWGRDGPRAGWGSYGASSAAHTGISFLCGLPDRPPAGLAVAYADENPPWLAASAVLMALHYRRRTGEGMYIDMAQTQAAASLTKHFYLDRSVNGRSARRPGFPPGNAREHPPSAPHNAFPCRGTDNWCVITVTTDDEWEGLKEAMGFPDWAENPRYGDGKGRFDNRADLEGAVAGWSRGFERYHLASLLQDHGVPAAPVQSSLDLAEYDPQLAHRGTFRIYDHPENGRGRYKTQAPSLSKTPYQPKRAIPTMGEDNYYVLHELLSLSDEEIEALAIEDVIRMRRPIGAWGGW
jgi:crotonobetainyl-CoA:carnitine CoA-transferase CaiB-like acyl-CoA transferase